MNPIPAQVVMPDGALYNFNFFTLPREGERINLVGATAFHQAMFRVTRVTHAPDAMPSIEVEALA